VDVTAIVVARGGSKRLPGKALLPFAGSTLVGHKVQQLKGCVARVVIGSDCPRILAEGERYGAIPLQRDPAFCDEVSRTANDMIADVVSRVDGDVILWAHPTNPLVRAGTYAAALAAFANRHPALDSLLSVYTVKRHAWWHHGPFNHQPWSGTHQVGAALEGIQFQDGAIFIQPRLQMVKNRSFYGQRPFLFEMDPLESTDIDTKADYLCAKALLSGVL
jgi:CMP-N,N'-diacetyllegionaminic acid synthase